MMLMLMMMMDGSLLGKPLFHSFSLPPSQTPPANFLTKPTERTYVAFKMLLFRGETPMGSPPLNQTYQTRPSFSFSHPFISNAFEGNQMSDTPSPFPIKPNHNKNGIVGPSSPVLSFAITQLEIDFLAFFSFTLCYGACVRSIHSLMLTS